MRRPVRRGGLEAGRIRAEDGWTQRLVADLPGARYARTASAARVRDTRSRPVEAVARGPPRASLRACGARSDRGRVKIEFWGLGREGRSSPSSAGIHRKNRASTSRSRRSRMRAREALERPTPAAPTPDISQLGNTLIPGSWSLSKALEDLAPFRAAARVGVVQKNYFPVSGHQLDRRGALRRPVVRGHAASLLSGRPAPRAGFDRPPRTWAEWEGPWLESRTSGEENFDPDADRRVRAASHLRSQQDAALLASMARAGIPEPATSAALLLYSTCSGRAGPPSLTETQISTLAGVCQGYFTFYITGPWNTAS